MDQLFERDPRALNKNRKGPLKELWAIVDVDIQGNANILKAVMCSHGIERPMIAVEENAFDAIKQAFWDLQTKTRRKLQLVRFTMVEIIEG